MIQPPVCLEYALLHWPSIFAAKLLPRSPNVKCRPGIGTSHVTSVGDETAHLVEEDLNTAVAGRKYLLSKTFKELRLTNAISAFYT